MTLTAFANFWDIIGWVFALNQEALQTIIEGPGVLILAIAVVLLAGLSQAIAQSIILFVNRVSPIRFLFSLLINVVLFAAGFFFLVFSTWLITLVPWSVHLPLSKLITVLGLSYTPLLFSFLGALPYLGVPILSGLSIWHLLAMVVGFAAAADLGLGEAFGYVAFGWLVLQILQTTIGQPIAHLGRWLTNQVAGVELVTGQQELTSAILDQVQDSAAKWQQELRQRLVEVQRGNIAGALAGGSIDERSLIAEVDPTAAEPLRPPSLIAPSSVMTGQDRKRNRTFSSLSGFVAMALITVIVVVLFRHLRNWWFGWYEGLPRLLQFTFNLGWMVVIAIVVAGILAPLETLGWWAGWYDDEIDTTVNAGELAEPVDDHSQISRYMVYLDGIGKSTFEYLPDIEEFLNTLAPTLPDDVALIRGIMPYSVMNNPLDEDRPLALLWKLADKARIGNPMSLLGLLINIRNVFIVGVSADRRYGPLYNQGIAQVVYNGLIKNGYRLNSGTPVTLIGYSGGGQMACACAPLLKRALSAPINVISLGGVISGNCNILRLEHLYHLMGDYDVVEHIGRMMFPGRWKLFPLSYWNRARRRGKISVLSLGPVGHQVPGGMLDPECILSDGRSALQRTIDTINAIVQGDMRYEDDLSSVRLSNYELYIQSAVHQPDYYPIRQSLLRSHYQPIGTWMGRLILPKPNERQRVQGVWFEVYHADAEHQSLVGRVVKLRWQQTPSLKRLLAAVRQDIHFSAAAAYTSKYGGLVHPDRLNHWHQVGPLESLAGAHPKDDLIVMLNEPVEVTDDALYIASQPVQITGRFYALVQFIEPITDTDQFRVVHFNPISRQFDGPEEIVRLPQVELAQAYGSHPSTSQGIEHSPLNETGWYIYGAADAQGLFVVQALGPRSLFRLQPQDVIFGQKASYNYIHKRAWANAIAQKGHISSVLCHPQAQDSPHAAIEEWQEGDRALLLHVYGGIGGKQKEPAAKTPLFAGHFAFGAAQVVREPITEELQFDLRYYQVYTHNTDGLVSGVFHWSRYMGDRQFGWAGARPVCDVVIKHDAFTGSYDFDHGRRSPLDLMLTQLQVMTCRYRTGDGTGGTYVGPTNNCVQDSNQALFNCLQQLERQIYQNAAPLQSWGERHPEQAHRFRELIALGKDLKLKLQPVGDLQADWERNEFNLGCTLEDYPLRNLVVGLGSWRTLVPRFTSDTIARIFLQHGASVWVLRTNQIGGYDPNIEPIVPITL